MHQNYSFQDNGYIYESNQTTKLPINLMAFLFAVNVCKCSSENSCFIEVEREHSWPSTGQAIGILIGVLLIIGKSLFLG